MRRVAITEQHGIFTIANLEGTLAQATSLETAFRVAAGKVAGFAPAEMEVRSVHEASVYLNDILGPERHAEQIHTREAA